MAQELRRRMSALGDRRGLWVVCCPSEFDKIGGQRSSIHLFDEFDFFRQQVPILPNAYYFTTPRYIRHCSEFAGDSLLTMAHNNQIHTYSREINEIRCLIRLGANAADVFGAFLKEQIDAIREELQVKINRLKSSPGS